MFWQVLRGTVSGISEDRCVVLALKESLWEARIGGWDGWRRGVPGWGVSPRQVGVFWFWVHLLFPGKCYLWFPPGLLMNLGPRPSRSGPLSSSVQSGFRALGGSPGLIHPVGGDSSQTFWGHHWAAGTTGLGSHMHSL